MADPEAAMVAYARLADVSRLKSQTGGQDKFLILTGIAALRAGWPDVAERCREIVAGHAPRHLLAGYDTFADALRDADFQPFVRRMERFCSVERAESLLAGLGFAMTPDLGDRSPGEFVLNLLAD